MKMVIHERLVALAQSVGVSQYGLAQDTSLSQPYVNAIFRGVKTPTIVTLEKLCAALGVTLSEFFSDEPPALSPETRQLIDAVEGLPPDKVKALVEVARGMR